MLIEASCLADQDQHDHEEDEEDSGCDEYEPGSQDLVTGANGEDNLERDVDGDGGVAVSPWRIWEESVVYNERETKVFNFVHWLVEPLAFDIAGPSECVFRVDKGTGEEITLIVDRLLIAADLLRG